MESQSLPMDASLQSYLRNYQISSFVCGSFGFICCLIILLSEIKYSLNTTPENRIENSNKWSRSFVFITISLATLSQFLVIVDAFPADIFPICIYTTPLMVATWGQKLVFLGLWQIKRLQVLTSRDESIYGQTHFPFVIKALYIGAIFISIISASLIFGLISDEYGKYGCTWEFTPIIQIMSIPAMISYLLWDGCTLIAYIYKLHQYRKSIKTSDPSSNIVQKALSKILLLTVIYELLSGGAGIGQLALSSLNPIISAMYWFLVALSDVSAALMLYLLQKHNRKQYKIFMHILWKMHLFFCCPQLADDAAALTKDEKNIQSGIDKTKGTTNSTNGSNDSNPTLSPSDLSIPTRPTALSITNMSSTEKV